MNQSCNLAPSRCCRSYPLLDALPQERYSRARLAYRSLDRLGRLVQEASKLTLPTTMALHSLDKSLRVEKGTSRVRVSVVVWKVSLGLCRSKALEQRDRVGSVVDVLDFPGIGDLFGIVGERPVALQCVTSPVVARHHTRDNGRGFLGLDIRDHLAEVPAESVDGLVDAGLCEDSDGLASNSRQSSSVFDIGSRIDVVVVAHLDEDEVTCFGGRQQSRPEALVDEGAGGPAVPGEVVYCQGSVVVDVVAPSVF
jgi:hypothetical protein